MTMDLETSTYLQFSTVSRWVMTSGSAQITEVSGGGLPDVASIGTVKFTFGGGSDNMPEVTHRPPAHNKKFKNVVSR